MNLPTRYRSLFWYNGGQLTLLDRWAAKDAAISPELHLVLEVDIEALDFDTWAEQSEHVHRTLCAQLGIDAPPDAAVLASSAAIRAKRPRARAALRKQAA